MCSVSDHNHASSIGRRRTLLFYPGIAHEGTLSHSAFEQRTKLGHRCTLHRISKVIKLLPNVAWKREICRLQNTQNAGERRLQAINLTRQTTVVSRLEIADTAAKRAKGLLGRMQLAKGTGMWIVPCEAIHTFGMQFPIDLVYLNHSNEVVKLCSAVKRNRMSMCISAHSVLELSSGTLLESPVQIGDSLHFEFV
jgi:uncharacterized membrane protein (UPF0127 family)